MEREVRYCTAEDGVRLAYCVEGDGTPFYVLPWFGESFSLLHLIPHYEQFFKELGEGRALIYADARGCGLSQRNVEDFSFPALVNDVRAVTRAAGVDRFRFWAGSRVSQVAIAFAAQYPAEITDLIFYAPAVQKMDAAQHEGGRAFAQLARTNWETFTRTIADSELRRRSDETGLRYAQWLQQSTSGETMARLFETFINVDVSPFLADISARTLILHRRDDAAYPDGQRLAAEIPGARFVPLPEGSIFLHDNTPVLDAIDAFLGDRPGRSRSVSAPEAPAPFRTVLFTDVVQNTTLLAEIGDDAWRAVMREHEDIVRAALKDHGGTEISTSGDGFFASFASATRALQCAVETQRALAARNASAKHPVEVRIGLNAGEPIEDGKDLVGTAVTLAARIMAQATAGQILTSDVVRQLVAGKNFSFADAGDFVPKGFTDPVRLFEVRWQPAGSP